jgi:hypothetical protein
VWDFLKMSCLPNAECTCHVVQKHPVSTCMHAHALHSDQCMLGVCPVGTSMWWGRGDTQLGILGPAYGIAGVSWVTVCLTACSFVHEHAPQCSIFSQREICARETLPGLKLDGCERRVGACSLQVCACCQCCLSRHFQLLHVARGMCCHN